MGGRGLTGPASHVFDNVEAVVLHNIVDGGLDGAKSAKEITHARPWRGLGDQYQDPSRSLLVSVSDGSVSSAFTDEQIHSQIRQF
jgi:hypothetical protein